ncbi:hypothetical protein BH24ACT10_BH24ACT10_18080 [soil metagenome]
MVHRGTAELRPGRAADAVRANEVGAEDDVRVLPVPVLRRRRTRAHRGVDEWRTPLPPWAMRLARALRVLRRARGDVPLDVAWSDDGRTCRLLAVRPPT